MAENSDAIVITRFRLYPAAPGRPGPVRWSYNYVVPGDPQVCQYGPGLVSLRARLKFRYPGVAVVERW